MTDKCLKCSLSQLCQPIKNRLEPLKGVEFQCPAILEVDLKKGISPAIRDAYKIQDELAKGV